MKSGLGRSFGVAPHVVIEICGQEPLGGIKCQRETQVSWFIADDPYRIDRLVRPLGDSHEPDDRQLGVHGIAQGDVLGMLRIVPPVHVALQPVGSDRIDVRRRLARIGKRRPDGQRGGHARRLPDATLAIHERYALTLVLEGRQPGILDALAGPPVQPLHRRFTQIPLTGAIHVDGLPRLDPHGDLFKMYDVHTPRPRIHGFFSHRAQLDLPCQA